MKPRHNLARRRIAMVVRNFDFEAAYKMANAMGWFCGLDTTPPSIEKMKSSVIEHFNNAIDYAESDYNDPYIASCGSYYFEAIYLVYECRLKLYFGLTKCHDGWSH